MSKATLGFGVIAFAIMVLALLWTSLGSERDAPAYPYSQLLADAAAGRVEGITQEGTRLIVSVSGEAEPRHVIVASESINVYAEVCAAAGAELGECPIPYAAASSEAGQLAGLLITSLLPVLLIGAFIFFMMRHAQRQDRGG